MKQQNVQEYVSIWKYAWKKAWKDQRKLKRTEKAGMTSEKNNEKAGITNGKRNKVRCLEWPGKTEKKWDGENNRRKQKKNWGAWDGQRKVKGYALCIPFWTIVLCSLHTFLAASTMLSAYLFGCEYYAICIPFGSECYAISIPFQFGTLCSQHTFSDYSTMLVAYLLGLE